MRIYSWNINGFRAILKKGFWGWVNDRKPNILCLQEVKATPEQIKAEQREHRKLNCLWNYATVKKGYSGTVTYYRKGLRNYKYDLPQKRLKGEGRLIQSEFKNFYLFNVYFPNGGASEERLKYKLDFYDCFLKHIEKLREHKPIIICGDVNTAHTEKDIANPKANSNVSGFLPIEREWITKLLNHGYVDTFRMFNDEPRNYTWWSYRGNARARNSGWRLDYFIVSEEIKDNVVNSWIESDVYGSDHCPIGLEIKFNNRI